MRALPFLFVLAATGCAAPETAPSLAPRSAEAIDPRVPVPEPAVVEDADATLVRQLEALVGQATAGDQAFRASADDARRLAAAAGGRESESWIVAQQALSGAVSARAPVTQAIAEIDSLGAQRVIGQGGIAAANLKAIEAAAAEVSRIDEREAATISAIQALLAR